MAMKDEHLIQRLSTPKHLKCGYYRRLLIIKWTDKVSNDTVLERMNINFGHLSIIDKLARRKMEFAGQVLRGYIVGRRYRGRQRRTWADDLKKMVKRKAKNKTLCRGMVANLLDT